MTVLTIEDLRVGYGDVEVVHGISLEVRQGEIISLVGANGAGKSSVLKAISGLLTPTGGSIRFKGDRIDTCRPPHIVAMGIAHVPEGRQVFTNCSVLENLELGSYSRRARQRRAEILANVFEMFPILSDRRSQFAGTLSGGEQQMLAIGRSLMACPELLIVDECSLGLAPVIIQRLFRSIRAINEGGVTILLVEQNIRQALRLSHRAYVLENGQMAASGKSEELLGQESIRRAYLGL